MRTWRKPLNMKCVNAVAGRNRLKPPKHVVSEKSSDCPGVQPTRLLGLRTSKGRMDNVGPLSRRRTWQSRRDLTRKSFVDDLDEHGGRETKRTHHVTFADSLIACSLRTMPSLTVVLEDRAMF